MIRQAAKLLGREALVLPVDHFSLYLGEVRLRYDR
jgi:hypothetical protein